MDAEGGTPGAPNSFAETIPDNFGPQIQSVTAIAADSIEILFSEKIDPSSAFSAQIAIEPDLLINEFSFDFRNPRTLFVILDMPMIPNNPYSIIVNGVFDCSGNEVQSEEVTFALPLLPEAGEIKLSEVLFNPRPNGVDFVEIFNDSEKYLSLKNWQLARITDGAIADKQVITNKELVITPKEYLVFTESAEMLLNNYPKGQLSQFFQMASLPAYNDDEGTVYLLHPEGEIIEQFSYQEDFHYDLLEDEEGVSLERISFAEETNQPDNWRSAASTEGFATPGYANSQSFLPDVGAAKVSISPKVFIPGNSGSGRDFTTINYQLDTPGQFANVNIYDQNGRLVRNLAQGELLPTSGFLRWDGETNDGNMARLGYYVVFFELYSTAGNTEIVKETVVVGRDF